MKRIDLIKAHKYGDMVVIWKRTYGNDVGKAFIHNYDYKGFPGKQGALVRYVDRDNHYGFVAYTDMKLVRKNPMINTPNNINLTQRRAPLFTTNQVTYSEKVYKASFPYETIKKTMPLNVYKDKYGNRQIEHVEQEPKNTIADELYEQMKKMKYSDLQGF